MKAESHAWPSTIWDLVQRGREGPPEARKSALDELLRRYYTPARRFFQKALRVGDQDLDDVTQGFFTRFIEKDFLKNLREKKSFRGFIKVACRRHFINWLEARRARPEARPLTDFEYDSRMTEQRIDAMFDDEVRTMYLELAMERTRTELAHEGKESWFRLFEARAGSGNGRPPGYKALAAEFGISVYDVSNRLLGARSAFRRILVQLATESSSKPMEELKELGLHKYLS